MARNIADIKTTADLWLKQQVKAKQYVYKKSELDKAVMNYLIQEQILAELNNQYLFIKSNKETASSSFLNNLWVLVFQFLDLAFDENWYITGYYSYKFLVDNFSCPQKQITVSTQKKTNTIIELPAGISILASYDKAFEEKVIVTKDFLEAKLRTLKQEHIILSSTENEYRTFADEIVSVLKSSSRDEKYFIDYFSNNSNPVLMARLIGALRQVEDFTLRIELEALFKLLNSKIAIPDPFNEVRLTSSAERPSYINRLELSMLKAIEYLKSIEKPKRLTKKIGVKDVDDLIVEETYHSLTIEGYTVTRALIEYLKNDNEYSDIEAENLRNDVAMRGFMEAIKYIKKLITSSYKVTEQVSKKLFEELWKPAYNAKLFKEDVDIYRKHMVAIKGAQYVPPAHEKVPYMISTLFDMSEEIENGFEQAIFLHFFYVGIHPHSDGNGRISRFLMNLALIRDKYKWLTIKVETRKEYFAALERSQLEDDISYFAEFILKSYKL